MTKRERIAAWSAGLVVLLLLTFLYMTNFSPLSIATSVPREEPFELRMGETVRLKGSMLFITLEGLQPGPPLDPNTLGLVGGDLVSYNAKHWWRAQRGECRAGSGCTPRASADFPFSITLHSTDHETYAKFIVVDRRSLIRSEEARCKELGDLTSEQASCYLRLVDQFGDPSYCENIYHDEWKDSCLREAADATSDESYCERIGDDVLRAECIAQARGERASCDLYEGGRRDTCLLETLKGDIDPSTCESMTTDHNKDTCWHVVSRAQKDAQFCERIVGTDRADFCWTDASGYDDGSAAEYCDKVVQKDTGECWTNAAKQTGDPQYCELVPPGHTYHRVCWTAIAQESGDAAICERIDDDYFRNRCVSVVGDAPAADPTE